MSKQNILKDVRVGRGAESETTSGFMRTLLSEYYKVATGR